MSCSPIRSLTLSPRSVSQIHPGRRRSGRLRTRATTRCKSSSASVSTPTVASSTAPRVCVRGTEQWTVRAGRRLSSATASTNMGPIHYSVVEPFRAIGVSLNQYERARISFNLVVRGSFDASLEARQPGFAVRRIPHHPQHPALPPGRRSLGLRSRSTAAVPKSLRTDRSGSQSSVENTNGIGKPIPGLPRGGRQIKQMFMTWLPMTLTRPDGSAYSLFVMYQEERGDGFTEIRCQAEQQNADGTSHRFASVEDKRCASKTTTDDSPTERSP